MLGHVVMAQYAMTGVTEVLEKVSLGDIRASSAEKTPKMFLNIDIFSSTDK